MFDFISIALEIDPEIILFNPQLNFNSLVNTDTGEELGSRHGYTKRVATLNGLEIDYIKNHNTQKESLNLSGSIHKYCHDGKNHKDFEFAQLERTLNNLFGLLKIDYTQTKIHRLEFGLNIIPEHPTNEILNSLICYKGQPYEMREFKGKGYLKKFILKQYEVKIYNKAKQYGLDSHLMRFEIKVNKMDYLLKKGVEIRNISDLLKPEVHSQLKDLLIKTFENILFYDYRIYTNSIKTVLEREILLKGANTSFWRKYKQEHSVTAYKLKVKRFRELVLEHSTSDLQNEIKNQIVAKWELLSTYPLLPNVKPNSTYPKLPVVGIVPLTQNYTHIVGNIEKQVQRFCVTCGRDITHQKKGSKFCSEKLYGQQVKNCRNKVSNRKQFELKCYSGLLLFDMINLTGNP